MFSNFFIKVLKSFWHVFRFEKCWNSIFYDYEESKLDMIIEKQIYNKNLKKVWIIYFL